MPRKGLIITQQGIDIERAPDFKKVFDSSWPILEISHEMIVDFEVIIPAGGSDVQFRYPLLKHDLGFRPAFSYVPDDKYDAFGSGYSFHDAGFHSYNLEPDNDQIYLTALFLAFELPVQLRARGYLRVFNYDPRVEFKAKSEPLGGDTRKSRYGVKILKTGSTSLRDDEFSRFSLNSRAKSLTIHQSGLAHAGEDNNFTATIKHDLDYLPSYMIFDALGRPNLAARQYGDAKKLTFSGVQAALSGNFPYIVFKDPLMEQAK